MECLSERVALVTGASSGIGEAIAKALVVIGIHVIGIARREWKLEEIAKSLEGENGSFHPLYCDLRKEQDILKVFRFAEDKFGGIDILVNNAGIYILEPITNGSTEHFQNILDVNTLAPAITIREGVKAMRKRGNAGHIININSIDGIEILQIESSLYQASKFALHAITENVRQEIAERLEPIKVTGIYPGAVKTPMLETAGVDAKVVRNLISITAKDVAASVLYALNAPDNVQIERLQITPLHGPKKL